MLQFAPPAEALASECEIPVLIGLNYRRLTGCKARDADIDDNQDFDRHVLASILDAANLSCAKDIGRAGLDGRELGALLQAWFPYKHKIVRAWDSLPALQNDSEVDMVRDLLLANRSTPGDIGRWLSAMIARRAMEPNHLWEDLGLRERNELTRLLSRHFAPLASRNTKNMRWKRFFYRMLCEDDGLVMCATPVCTQCRDFDLCFGDESGESRLAERRREIELRADAEATPSSA